MDRDGNLWSRDFKVMMLVGLSVSLTNLMTGAALPLYIGHIGGSSAVVGLVMGVFPLAALLGRPVSGSLLDSRGRRLVLLTGVSLVLLAAVLYNFSAVLLLLVLVRLIHGAGFSGSTTAAGTIVVDITSRPNLPSALGYFGLSNVLSFAVGPAVAFFVVERYSFALLFQLVAAVALLGVVGALTVRYRDLDLPRDDEAPLEEDGPLRAGSAVWPAAASMLLVAFTVAAPLTYLPPYAQTLGIANIGLFFTVYAVSSSATRVFAGRLSRRLGYTKVVVPSIGCLIVGALLLWIGADLPLFLTAAVFSGLGFGTLHPLINTLLVRMSPASKRGAASAKFFSSLDIGFGSGAVVWGLVAQRFGYPALFLGAVFVAGLAAIPYLAFYRRL